MGIPHAFSVKSENAELFVSFAGAGTDGPLGTGVDGFFKEVATPVARAELLRSLRCPTSQSSDA